MGVRLDDEWRLQVDFGADERARALTGQLDAGRVQHDLSLEFQDRVIVSRDEARVFVYAGSRDQIDRATSAICSLSVNKCTILFWRG